MRQPRSPCKEMVTTCGGQFSNLIWMQSTKSKKHMQQMQETRRIHLKKWSLMRISMGLGTSPI